MPRMLMTQAQSLKAAVANAHAAVLELHRRGGDAFSGVRRLTAEIDAILIRIFTDTFGPSPDDVALLAVGGYGRSELCPQSDIDILILRQRNGTATSASRSSSRSCGTAASSSGTRCGRRTSASST